ncbi:MAG: hypothetical protein MUC49_22760 [Raineya sp.]|nr:hypothetical protein [Raineya sp.]
MNNHFQKTYGNAFAIFYNEKEFWEWVTDSHKPFEVLVRRVMNSFSSIVFRDYLGINYGVAFRELWKWSPTYEVLSILLTVDLKAKETNVLNQLNIHKGSDDIILETILSSLQEGWVTFHGLDEEPYGLPEEFTGRLSMDQYYLLDPGDGSGMLLPEKTHDLANRIIDRCSVSEPFEDPEKFWQTQSLQNPHKVVEALIHTVFKDYTMHIDHCQTAIDYIQEYEDFSIIAEACLHLMLRHTPHEIIDYYPKYAGYSQVTDSVKWLETLLAALEGNAQLIDLGERK